MEKIIGQSHHATGGNYVNTAPTSMITIETLRSRQIAALRQLINMNQPVSTSTAVEPVWKVLVLDQYGQDIISPLLSVKELRDLGVTLHLLLDKIRECLQDVPCVYFVQPTVENIRIICNDFVSSMYESFYLNFIGALSRPNLETLATAAVQHTCVPQVQKYLNFISLDDDLFVLRRYEENSSLSFYAINRPDMSDEAMSGIVDSIVDSLFSVCVTLGVVPLIRCPRNNAAEQVAERLDKKLRDNLRDGRNNLFTQENVRAGQFNFQRPVLVILDRGMDLATMLHHTWTYQALIHDVLDLDLNRVVVRDASSSSGAEKRKEYDMNAADKLWMKHKGSPFPQVAEAVQEELEAYRSSEDEIKRLKHVMGFSGGEPDETFTMFSDTTAKLTSTVSGLPELLERKRLIDLHTNVATAVLDHIKRRKLDLFFEMEEKLLNRQTTDTALIDALRDDDRGSVHDKLRLFLLNYICSDISESELKEQMAVLTAAGADDSAVKFVKRWKSFSKMFSRDDLLGAGTRTESMFSKLLNTSSRFVMEGVKNLVPKKHNLPITKVVDAIMDVKSNAGGTDDYRYFDPKLMRASESNMPRSRAPANDVIVFVIGGGNYVEYQNLVDYRKSRNATHMRITYGTTELVNATQFLTQFIFRLSLFLKHPQLFQLTRLGVQV